MEKVNLKTVETELLLAELKRRGITQCVTHIGEAIASIPLEYDGHFLQATASIGDYPQIEVTIDGDARKTLFVTEFQDDEDNPEEYKVKTYFYYPDDPCIQSEVSHTYSQKFQEYVNG